MAGDEAPKPASTEPESDELVVAPENVGRTGYGEVSGPMYTMYQQDVAMVEDFPDHLTPLERKNWYNYSLSDERPPYVAADVEENRRIWQEMDIERMLDHHPTHEIHPNDLPDYHYWPMIQNEVKPKGYMPTQARFRYHQDETDLPRFFKSGVPKTPPQEQDFYIPLRADGRFDWRRNIVKNGYSASLFDKRGWERRYHVAVNRPQLPLVITGLRNFATMPIHFKQFELPINIRLVRHWSASAFERHAIFAGIYCGTLIYFSSKDAHWRKLNWDNEPWNFDMSFMMYNRDKGGFHGVI